MPKRLIFTNDSLNKYLNLHFTYGSLTGIYLPDPYGMFRFAARFNLLYLEACSGEGVMNRGTTAFHC